MAELADVQDLGSCVAGRVGSNPTNRMKKRLFAKCFLQKAFSFFETQTESG